MTDSKYVVGQRVEVEVCGGDWEPATVTRLDATGVQVRPDSSPGERLWRKPEHGDIRPLADVNTASMAAVLKECAPYPAAQPAKDWRPGDRVVASGIGVRGWTGTVVTESTGDNDRVAVRWDGDMGTGHPLRAELHPLPAAAPAPREPRVGDVWRGLLGSEWKVLSAAGAGTWNCISIGSGTNGVITLPSVWTLVRAAEDAPHAEHRGEPKTLPASLPLRPLRCPCCPDGTLTRAHTVAVYRCAECHWTGTEADRARASEPVRPEPRFKVGDRVCCNWDDAARVCQVMKVVRYDATDRCWVYSVRHEYAGGEAFVALPQETSLTAAERP